MKILMEATGLCGTSLFNCFCIVLLLFQLGEGKLDPVPHSSILPNNGKN